jgi:hypothetical protein
MKCRCHDDSVRGQKLAEGLVTIHGTFAESFDPH